MEIIPNFNEIAIPAEIENNNDLVVNDELPDLIENYDELLEDEESNLHPLEINSYEQLKLFLTNAKNFFTSNIIENVALLILSNNSMKSLKLQQIVADIAITFSKTCETINQIEQDFGSLSSRTILDKIIIDSIQKISNNIISDSIPYSTYISRIAFEEVSKYPEYFAEITINKQLIDSFNKLIDTNIEVTEEYAKNIQNELISKYKILNVVKSIREFSRFISRDASQYNNINEFLNQFSNIINSTSLNISEVVGEEDSGLTMKDVLASSFYKTVIRTKSSHIKCGLTMFDSITNGGFEQDRVYLLAGKTGGGKSTVLLNIAYGMYKYGNGMILPEVEVFNKLGNNIEAYKRLYDYCLNNVKNRTDLEAIEFGEEHANKKHMILYVTLENTEYETIKRFMCRMGLISNVVWTLIERDETLRKLVQEKGFRFKYEDLPVNMDLALKKQLCAISDYTNILSEVNKTEFKVWWRPPYTINAYDVFMEAKRIERSGYIIDAIFVDYPDKMKAVDTNRTDQSWDLLGKIIDNLKGLSKQLHLPIIGVSQLTRQGNKDSGNKNLIIKGGATAGSQQKESNTDTLINMNIHSREDEELNSKVEIFKNYHRTINRSKSTLVNNIFNTDNRVDITLMKQQQDELTKQAEYASDILQLAFSMPDIQTISNYIVKNRDGASDITFETYIVYGMYLVTDYDEEAMFAAKFSVDIFNKIVNYMHDNKLLNDHSVQISRGMTTNFDEKLNAFRMAINSSIKNGAINNIPSKPTIQKQYDYDKPPIMPAIPSLT